MALAPPLFVSPKADPNPDPTLLQPSMWNRMVALLNTVFDGSDPAGSVLTRDPTDAGDGARWVPSAAGVLACSGAGAAPIFRPLTAADVPPPVLPADVTIGNSVAIGATPAASGAIRLANNQSINWRNAANTNDIVGLLGDPYDAVEIGYGSVGVFFHNMAVAFTDNAYDLGQAANRWRNCLLGTSLAIGTNPAQSGAIRLASGSGSQISARNAANTADLSELIQYSNCLYVGDIATGLALRTNLTVPPAYGTGDCWIDAIGSSPNRQLRLAVSDGGVIYSVNIGAPH